MRSSRLVSGALAVAAAAAGIGSGAGTNASARAAAPPALAAAYDSQAVDSPAPVASAQMGWLGIASAGDVDGDGAADVLAPEPHGPGRIHVFSGATGALIYTLDLPDPSDAPGNDSAGSFIYPAQLPDVASCPGGTLNQDCPLITEDGDGRPEILVGATGVDIGAIVDIGRAYVFDGATGALLKRVQMPPDDLASEATHAPKGFSFGRSVLSPFNPYDPSPPPAVRIGDIDEAGEADFLVGNPTYWEDGPATNASCDPGPCPGSGRVYVFRGEDVVGAGGAILDTPLHVVKNPMAQTGGDHERFGHATIAVGDVGQCNAVGADGITCASPSSTVFDNRTDFVVSAHATDFPEGVYQDSGVVWLIDGGTGTVLRRYVHPDPQPGAQFGYHSGSMPTGLGDVGGSVAHADFFVPAVVQSEAEAGQGRGWVLNGQFTTFSGTVTLAALDDPTPQPGANFGGVSVGVGDVAGDAHGEILVGQQGPLWPRDFEGVSDVHFFDVSSGQPVLTVTDPDEQAGSGFGQGVANLGDVNGDGLLDFAVAAGYFDGAAAGQGRLYIFRSRPPVEEVARTVTLRLRRHLRAKGSVTAAEGFEACVGAVPVVIRRNGAAVRETTTDADGRYSVRVPDRAGRYRAVATPVAAGDLTCTKARSDVVRHVHG